MIWSASQCPASERSATVAGRAATFANAGRVLACRAWPDRRCGRHLRANVLFVGNPGTAKSHLATRLAAQGCACGYKTRFFRVTDLSPP